jgi:hypothetical protein
MSWKKYFKPVNAVLPISGQSSYSVSGSVNKYGSWLPEVYMGPPDRLQRYTQYELMNMDHEVCAALDTIAEFSTQPTPQKDIPFSVFYRETPTPQEVTILGKYLQQWTKLNDMSRRMFRIFRSTLMYGDQIFVRDPETYKLYWVDPNFVEKIVVNESQGKDIETYFIKNLDLNLQQYVSTNQQSRTDGGYVNSSSMYPNVTLGQRGQRNTISTSAYTSSGGTSETISFPIDASNIVHISLTEGMDGAWPFGMSILETVYKVFKQKELLEDAILIYRIHRAPERRIFKIDTGTLPPHKAQQYLERIKHEVQQKRIPNKTGGGASVVDSAYNPLSTLEDYFFATGPDGRGSSVDTLKGGENLGEINDLKYFNNKMLRALGVPSSYLPTGPDDGTASKGDGKVGNAFIQEFRFSEKCKRFQRQIMKPLDMEFKLFLKARGITIDSSLFEIQLNEPQNFAKYRQIELDSAAINLYQAVAEVPHISKRYALKRYLGWTEDELILNERMVLEERLGPDSPDAGSPEAQSGMRQAGIASSDFAGGDVDFGDEDMGGEDMDMGDEGGDMEGGEADVSQEDIDSFGKD